MLEQCNLKYTDKSKDFKYLAKIIKQGKHWTYEGTGVTSPEIHIKNDQVCDFEFVKVVT